MNDTWTNPSLEYKTVKFGYAGITDVESHYTKTKLI